MTGSTDRSRELLFVLGTAAALVAMLLAGAHWGVTGVLAVIGVLALPVAVYLALRLDPAWLLTAALLASVFSGNWNQLGLPNLIAPDRLLLIVGVAALLIRAPGARDRPSLRLAPVHLLLAASLAYAVASAISVQTLTTQEGGFRLLDRFGALPFLMFVVGPIAFRGPRQRAILLGGLVLLGAYLGLTALFETVGPKSLVWPRYILDPSVGFHVGRARGPFVEAEADGLAMMITGVAAAVAMSVWRRLPARLLAGAVAVLCAAGCLFTLQRAVWIAAAAGCILAGLAAREIRRFLIPGIVVAGLLVLGALAVVPNLKQNATQRTNDQLSVWDRQNLNTAAVNMIQARPLAGFGWDKFANYSPDYFHQADTYPVTALNGTIAHSVVLSNAVELGLPGATLWLLAVIVAVGGAITQRGPPQLYAWRIGLIAVAVAWIVVLNLTPLPHPFPNLMLWTWAGVVSSWRYQRHLATGPVAAPWPELAPGSPLQTTEA